MNSRLSPRTVYIHIGTHKTGTTAIQTTLLRNHANLLNLNYLYPTTVLYAAGHHHIPWFLSGHPAYDRFWKNSDCSVIDVLFDDINKHDQPNLILSSENFYLCNSRQLEPLAELFKNCRVVLILFLRRQDRFLESWYSHVVTYNNYHMVEIREIS
jgi:hypothetical protein